MKVGGPESVAARREAYAERAARRREGEGKDPKVFCARCGTTMMREDDSGLCGFCLGEMDEAVNLRASSQ